MRRIAILMLFLIPAWAATIKPSYRATNTSLAITLNSLANSTSQSTGIRGAAYVDNTSNLDVDEQVYVVVKTASSGTSATGSVVVYAYGCTGGTTSCTDSVTGTDAAQTLTNPTNLIQIGICNAVANATTYTCGPWSISAAFGGAVPARWGIVAQNETGAALSSSGNSAVYDSIQLTSN
jgi:hypothetical protein